MSIWSWIKRVKALPSEEIRGNALPTGNTSTSELRFSGVKLIAVEEEWDDERNLPLRPDSIGLCNRLAIYQKQEEANPARFVAEQLRYNVGPVIVPLGKPREDVFVSFSEEFSSFEEAVEWILAGQMVSEGNLRESFSKEVEIYRRKYSLSA